MWVEDSCGFGKHFVGSSYHKIPLRKILLFAEDTGLLAEWERGVAQYFRKWSQCKGHFASLPDPLSVFISFDSDTVIDNGEVCGESIIFFILWTIL
jgi:hypothetical protein